MALVGLWAGWLAWRKRDFATRRRFQWALVIAAPSGFLALEAGWMVTELGRQPWIIFGVLKTADAVTPMPGLIVPFATITLLFCCFPRAFATMAVGLHVPLTLMLIGIVLRGSAFVFQSYGGGGGRVFATASLVTPVLLGICVGAVASGTVWLGVRDGTFVTSFIRSWFTPFGFAVGIFTLACFSFLPARYFTLEGKDAELQEDFRQRAIAAGAAVFAMAVLGLAVFPQAPRVNERVVALTAAAALAAFWSLWRRRYKRARIAAAAQVTLIVWGWGIAQYPYLLPPDLTIAGAAAPRVTLELALIAVLAGAVVLFPSLYYLMRVFKRTNDH